MAQATNIEIPARFSFRPYRTRWFSCHAEIVDWCEKPTSRTMVEFHESVRVQVNVPTYTETLFGFRPAGPSPSYIVHIDREHIPTDVLRSDENPRNTHYFSDRVFDVLVCPVPIIEPTLEGLEKRRLVPGEVSKDAWEMRNEFLDWKGGTDELRGFLNRWGLWNWQFRPAEMGRGMVGESQPFALVLPHLIWERRTALKSGMAGKPSVWLKTAKPLSFSQSSEPPYFSMVSYYCEDAIVATISIDHLRGMKFRLCKLKDCRKPYLVKTKQKRMYCSTAHAHLANVRKIRAEERKAAKRGTENNAKG
jgi:hypothetical protein